MEQRKERVTFSRILRNFLQDRNWNKRELADFLGLSYDRAYVYLTGRGVPRSKAVVEKLATVLGKEVLGIDVFTFGARLKAFADMHGMKLKVLGSYIKRECSLSEGDVYSWVRGTSYPDMNTMMYLWDILALGKIDMSRNVKKTRRVDRNGNNGQEKRDSL